MSNFLQLYRTLLAFDKTSISLEAFLYEIASFLGGLITELEFDDYKHSHNKRKDSMEKGRPHKNLYVTLEFSERTNTTGTIF